MRAPFVVVDGSLAGSGPGTRIPLTGDQHHHLARVLRRGDGDRIELSDGAGRTAAAVLAGDAAEVRGAVDVHESPSPAVEVVHAVPKGRGLDEIVRTLAELGVAAVHPVLTARTESRPTGAALDRVTGRWRGIARSAAEQARSAHLCRIGTLAPLADWTRPDGRPAARRPTTPDRDGPPGELRIAAHPAATVPLGRVSPRGAGIDRVSVLIGPEGGLDDAELGALGAAGWTVARAGRTVVRSEHAATVLVSAILALVGRFDG